MLDEKLLGLIRRSMDAPLPAKRTERVPVLLYSPQAEEHMSELKTNLSNMYAQVGDLYFACISQESLDLGISRVESHKENLLLPPTAQPIIVFMLVNDEVIDIPNVPKTMDSQALRFVDNLSRATANPGELLAPITCRGYASVSLWLYLMQFYAEFPLKHSSSVNVLNLWRGSSTHNEWLRIIKQQLLAARYGDEYDPSHIENAGKRALQKFLASVPGLRPLQDYPFDAGYLRSYSRGVRFFRKKVIHDSSQFLRDLWGSFHNGKSRYLGFHEQFFLNNMALNSDAFNRAFSDAFVKIPIDHLTTNMESFLQKKLELTNDDYEQELHKSLKPISLGGRKPTAIVQAIESFEETRKTLYRLFAEKWFWEQAKEDFIRGKLQQNLVKATARIDAQLKILHCECTPGSPVSWNIDIIAIAEQYKPSPNEWTSDSLSDAIAENCDLDCLENTAYEAPCLYGLINSSHDGGFDSVNFKNGIAKAKWYTCGGLPKDCCIVLSMTTADFYIDSAKGGA